LFKNLCLSLVSGVPPLLFYDYTAVPKVLFSLEGPGPPPEILFLWLLWVHATNGISIGLSVLAAQFALVTSNCMRATAVTTSRVRVAE